MYYVAPDTPMMSSVIADSPDLAPPNILDKSTALRLCKTVYLSNENAQADMTTNNLQRHQSRIWRMHVALDKRLIVIERVVGLYSNSIFNFGEILFNLSATVTNCLWLPNCLSVYNFIWRLKLCPTIYLQSNKVIIILAINYMLLVVHRVSWSSCESSNSSTVTSSRERGSRSSAGWPTNLYTVEICVQY